MTGLNHGIKTSLKGIALLGFISIAACTTDTDNATTAIETTDKSNPVASNTATKQSVERIIETGHPISGITVIPATGHRGAAKLAVAHGNDGTTLYNFDGTVIWHDEKPAALVGFYQNTLIIYRNHEEATQLDTYTVTAQGSVSLESTASPSPIAATTIQRTAFSVVGPVRLDENKVVMGDNEIEMNEPVAAFAAVKQFIPLTSSITHVIALESGNVVIKSGG